MDKKYVEVKKKLVGIAWTCPNKIHGLIADRIYYSPGMKIGVMFWMQSECI